MRKRIILGGAQISYALSWEAEGRLATLLEEVKSGTPREEILQQIPGAWWRRDGKLTKSLASYAPVDFQHLRRVTSPDSIC
jgi:hypothetical protein